MVENPTTAAEWALRIKIGSGCTCYEPEGFVDCKPHTAIVEALDAFARQQVEIERSRWISDQCTANQAGQAMGRIEGYTEGWNAALEQAAQIADNGYGFLAGRTIASAIRALEGKI